MHNDTSNSIPLAIIISIAFNYPVNQILPYSMGAINNYIVDFNNKLYYNIIILTMYLIRYLALLTIVLMMVKYYLLQVRHEIVT